MAIATATALTFAATSMAVGTAASVYEGRKAREANERAGRIDEKRARLQGMKSSIEQIRTAQIARADIIQMGENQNVSNSSGVAGGVANTQSTATGNIGFAQQIFGLQQSYNRLREQANKHSFNAGAWKAMGSAGASIAGSYAAYTPSATPIPEGAVTPNTTPKMASTIGVF